jgi:cellulose biosynthesis protein BcsQ/DNA-binding XRE family transcriptional regulator
MSCVALPLGPAPLDAQTRRRETWCVWAANARTQSTRSGRTTDSADRRFCLAVPTRPTSRSRSPTRPCRRFAMEQPDSAPPPCPPVALDAIAAAIDARDMNLALLAIRVRTLRGERALTQEDLADIAGVDPKTVQRVERCAHRPSARVLQALAFALHVTPRALLRDSDHAERRPASHDALPCGHVTLIASPKAGTGRTMLAISLAGMFVHHGYRVLVIDFHDGCGSGWFLRWAHSLGVPAADHIREPHPSAAADHLMALRQAYDHVIVDSSACDTDDLVLLALRSDQVVLTTTHPQLDFGWRRRQVEHWLDVAYLHRVDVAAVLMAASPYATRRRNALRFLERIGLRVLDATIGHRLVYDRLIGRGQTVAQDERPGIAARELYALVQELGWPLRARVRVAHRDRRWSRDDHRYHQALHEHHRAVVRAR